MVFNGKKEKAKRKWYLMERRRIKEKVAFNRKKEDQRESGIHWKEGEAKRKWYLMERRRIKEKVVFNGEKEDQRESGI